MVNASNAESANNVKHLWQYCPGFRTETFSLDSPTDFSHGPVVVQPVRKYVVKSRFPFDLLSSLTFVANSARNECFVLSTSHFDCCLLASDWTHCSTLSANFSIFIISFFDNFEENVSSKRVTNYWTTIGAHCLILSSHFSTAEVLLLMAWPVAAKTTFILKTVQPLMVRLSLASGPAFQK